MFKMCLGGNRRRRALPDRVQNIEDQLEIRADFVIFIADMNTNLNVICRLWLAAIHGQMEEINRTVDENVGLDDFPCSTFLQVRGMGCVDASIKFILSRCREMLQEVYNAFCGRRAQ